MKLFVCAVICTFLSINLWAQQAFTVTGNVKNAKGKNQESATVFIDRSDRYTKTDANGNYTLANIAPGTYTIAVTMVGYGSENKMLRVSDKPVAINFIIKEKPIQLNEVVIGNDSRRAEMLKLFYAKFLGVTENGLSCKVLNPQIIEFTTNKNILLATTPDFLIIENPSLGYRIKYLLKVFRYDKSQGIASYTGDCIFEEMPGNEKQQSQWHEARLQAYKGSFMHYLRSLYAGNSTRQGFKSNIFLKPWPVPQSTINSKVAELTKNGVSSKDILDSINKLSRPTLKEEPEDMAKYVTRIDSNFVKIAFKPTLNVMYNKRRALLVKTKEKDKTDRTALVNNAIKGLSRDRPIVGVVTMFLDYTIVDRYGNYLDYRSFLREGVWNYQQMGDRLPFTYQPPVEPDLISIDDK